MTRHSNNKSTSTASIFWENSATVLAQWALKFLMNRSDAHGSYRPLNKRAKGPAYTSKSTLTQGKLVRHFRGRDVGDLIGFHTTSLDNTSRWLAIDLDNHSGETEVQETNLRAAIHWCKRLENLGYHPLLLDSDGRGSLHLIVVFSEPAPTAQVFALGTNLVSDFKTIGFASEPEIFPKQRAVGPHSRFGSWLRLPGRHHTRNHWTRVWNNGAWMEGQAAIDYLLAHKGDEFQALSVAVNSPSRERATDNSNSPSPETEMSSKTRDFMNNEVPVGERNNRLFAAACDLRGQGVPERSVLKNLTPAALKSGLSEDEIKRTVASACSQERTPSGSVATNGAGSTINNHRVNGKPPDDHKMAKKTSPFPWQPFPVEVLPMALRQFVVEASRAMGVDPVNIVVPALASIAGAIGSTRRIQLKRNWCEPAVFWGVIVNQSGNLKSPPMELALAPIRARQRKAMKKYNEEIVALEKRVAEHDDVRKRNTQLRGGLQASKVEPIPERFICSDTTIEALVGLLEQSPRGLLATRDEFSGWFGNLDRYRKGKGSDIAFWLECHRAGQLIIDRKTGARRTIFIPHAAVSLCGTIQPEVLSRVLGRENFENGLAARLIMAYPPNRPRVWSDDDLSQDTKDAFASVIDGLLEMKYDKNKSGELVPQDLVLTPDAKECFIRFYNEHGRLQSQTHDNDLAAAYSKLEGGAARLALLIHCCRVASVDPTLENENLVDAKSMKAGIALTRWFVYEARRVYALLSEVGESREHQSLVAVIERNGGRITPRELHNANKKYRPTDVAENRLAELIDEGLGSWIDEVATRENGTPKRVFQLHDRVDAYKRLHAPRGDSNENIGHDSKNDDCSVAVGA